VGRIVVGRFAGKYDLEEGYNLEGAKTIKPMLGDIPLILVGELRRRAHMEEILQTNHADLISMSRPFIREPQIVKKLKLPATCCGESPIVKENICFCSLVNPAASSGECTRCSIQRRKGRYCLLPFLQQMLCRN
jgi:2,4-dienoyl-CoA reductase-like NADH-dependent reductase (Old Yellow Enzyme family)